jgi:hypothetical protein
MSETLFLINPKRKRRIPAGLRRYWASHGRGRKKNSRRRRKVYVRHRRRNPVRHRRRRRNARYVHHRRRRRNPRSHRRVHRRRRNPFGTGEVKNVLVPAAIGAGGAIALAVAYGYLSPNIPDSVTSITGASAVIQGLGAVALGMLAGKFMGRQKGIYVAMGGLTVVLVNALTPYISSATGGSIPGMSGFGGLKLGGVGDYVPYRKPGMGFINPAPRLGKYMYPNARLQGLRGGMGAYMNRNVAGKMGAYLANSVPGMRGFGDVPSGYTGLNVG